MKKIMELHPEYTIAEAAEKAKFPCYLPLSLLDLEREDSYVNLRFWDVKVRLTCQQLSSIAPTVKKYGVKSFHEVLQLLQHEFSKKPEFESGDIERLIREGILIKKRNYFFGEEICKHGPRGFDKKEYKSVTCQMR